MFAKGEMKLIKTLFQHVFRMNQVYIFIILQIEQGNFSQPVVSNATNTTN